MRSMPLQRRKQWSTLSSARGESEDATGMTTCVLEGKSALAHDASPQHQVEAPDRSVPPVDEKKTDTSPTSVASQSSGGQDYSRISARVSHSSDPPTANNVAVNRSQRQCISRQDAISSPETSDSKIQFPPASKRLSLDDKLTVYFYTKASKDVKQSSNSLNKCAGTAASKSFDVVNMNDVCERNGACEEKGSDSDNFFEAEDPIVSIVVAPVESPGPPDLFVKDVKSPDSQSVETFLSAKSHVSGDELDANDFDEVEGVEPSVSNETSTVNDGMDNIDGPVHMEQPTSLSPNDSTTSSTLSPGSSGAPGVVVVPPSSPSSSQTVSSGSNSAVRPTTLGAIPKVKMNTLSPSYRPRDKKIVSVEAMRVLDSFLKRSYSQNDASPLLHQYQAVMEMERIEESTDADEGLKSKDTTDPDESLKNKDKDNDSLPDYDTCHSPVSKSNSVYSTGSQSSSFRNKIVPLTKKDVDDALKREQQRKKHLVKRRRKSSTSSSTTTEEEVQQERQKRRKRKSLFKKAKDKLRKSLKHRRESSFGGTKRSSDKSSSTQSPGKEVVGEVYTHTDRHVHTEVHPDPTHPDSSIVLRTETSHTTRDEKYPEKSGRHVETTVHLKESFPIKDKKDNRNLLESLIQYIRSGKAKLKRKSSKKRLERSKSVEEIPFEDPDAATPLVDNTQTSSTWERGGALRVTHECHTQIGGEPEEEEEDSADGPRRNLRLIGLLKYQPAVSEDEEKDEKRLIVSGVSGDHEVPYEVQESRHTMPSAMIADGFDDVDFHSPSVAEKPHLQRTHSEREHIYEKVADQLAAIADNYNFSSPLSPEKEKQDVATAEAKEAQEPGVVLGSKESAVDEEVAELGSYLRNKGDKLAEDMPQLNPIVKDLVRNVSYTHFQTVLHQQMGGENNIQQIALFFNIIKQSVQAVGYGTAMAMQLKEMSLQYFEDRYADWVIGQGGWESIAEETDLSSEVD